MIEHLVLFKLRNDLSDVDKQLMVKSLKNLPIHIPEIRSLTTGFNFSERNKGYTLGLRVLFEKKEDLKTYAEHPNHVACVRDVIKPRIEDIIVCDFEA